MALISSSVKCLNACQGIGGKMGLVLSRPLYLPSRKTFLNCSSVHIPIPVESLLMLAAYDCPQGPTTDVKSGANKTQPAFKASSLAAGNVAVER